MADFELVLRARDVLFKRRFEECTHFGQPAYIEVDSVWPCSIAAKGSDLGGGLESKVWPASVLTNEACKVPLPPGLPPPPGLSEPLSLEEPWFPGTGTWSHPFAAATARTSLGQPPSRMGGPAQPGQVLGWEQPVCVKRPMRAWAAQPAPRWVGQATGTRPGAENPTQQHSQRRHCRLLIAEALNKLHGKDARCIIYTSQIHSLGFASAEALREHFARFGPVRSVFLSNAHERCSSGPALQRVRPSRIGFVLMQHPKGAEAAIAEGAEQVVRGQTITVRRFECRPWDRAQEERAGLSGTASAADDLSGHPVRLVGGEDERPPSPSLTCCRGAVASEKGLSPSTATTRCNSVADELEQA